MLNSIIWPDIDDHCLIFPCEKIVIDILNHPAGSACFPCGHKIKSDNFRYHIILRYREKITVLSAKTLRETKTPREIVANS